MTQFPDNPPPGDEPELRDDAWDEPQRIGQAILFRRAAGAVWLLGVLEALVFGYFTLGALALSMLPEDELRKVLADAQDPTVIDMVVQQRWVFLPIAGSLALFGFVPGITYIVLGFFVRNARQAAISFALLIVLTQAIVVGVMLLAGVLGSIVQADPSALTVYILLMGTPMAMLVFTGMKLMQARTAHQAPDAGDDNEVEPWNRSW